MTLTPKDRLVVALDVPDAGRALELVSALQGSVGLFKVGMELFTAAGPSVVRDIIEGGEGVFLDLKFHDIPHTVRGAAQRAGHLGVSLLTVHGLGGRAMLEAAVEAVRGSETRVLAITVLTSHDQTSLAEVGVRGTLVDRAVSLARLAQACGVDGVVASPHEIAAIRGACGTDLLIVTPGIRPPGFETGDQARATTPKEAVAAGADYLVVGRPITAAADPVAAARAIVEEMSRS